MSPAPSRQTLLWSLPTLALLLSFLWYRRKKTSLKSDPGETAKGTKLLPSDAKKNDKFVNEKRISSLNPNQSSESFSAFFSAERAALVSKSESSVDNTIEVPHLIESVNELSSPKVNEFHSVETSTTEKELEVPQELVIIKEDSIIITDQKVKPISEVEKLITHHITEEEILAVLETTDQSDLENRSAVVDKISKGESFVETQPVTLSISAVKELGSSIFSESHQAREKTPEECLSTLSDKTWRTGDISEAVFDSAEVSVVPAHQSGGGVEEGEQEGGEKGEEIVLSLSSDNKKSSASSIDSSHDTIMARKTNDVAVERGSPEEEAAMKCSPSDVAQGDVGSSTASALEEKLSSLELTSSTETPSTGDSSGGVTRSEERHRAERDSANHSPADVMLASPSMSNYSDAQSEGSSDSGKGCSDVATPPSRTPASGSSVSGDHPLPSVYEFVLPQHLVGRLIGRHGCFVHQIKAKTHASILIKRHPDTTKLKICAVEGTQMDIESALEMIRQKFPPKRYPNVTLEQVCFLPPVSTFPLIPEFLQLQLVEGVNNDVILSSLVSPAHFFLQQPTHPTFPALNRLNACMSICYSEPSAPTVPSPVEAGIICAAPTMGGWYRAQVVSVDAENETSDIKFVDYGGYLTIENSMLRQIRSDFMTLPFQAAECYLANVNPVGGPVEGFWSDEAVAGMEELTQGQVLQAQVCGYSEGDGFPVVYLYAMQGSQVVFVNQELIARGLAESWEPTEA